MRLVAGTSWLKIAHFQFYVEAIEVGWYQSMSYIMCVSLPPFNILILLPFSLGSENSLPFPL